MNNTIYWQVNKTCYNEIIVLWSKDNWPGQGTFNHDTYYGPRGRGIISLIKYLEEERELPNPDILVKEEYLQSVYEDILLNQKGIIG